MFKMIGADGRQYGPISADQLRQWIREGRANAHTKIVAEGATDFKALSEYPEFAEDLSSAAGRTFTAGPATVAAMDDSQAKADAMASEILARDYQLEIGSCVSRGWELVKANFLLTVGATFIVILAVAAASFVPFAPLVLGLVLLSGLDWLFLKLVRGQRTELADAFAGFSAVFVPLMLFSIVGQTLTSIGFLLCILPGVYLTVIWMMFPGLLIMDKGLEFWPAMELSRKVVNRHWWAVFGLALVCLLLVLVGVLACGIGLLVTHPIAIAAVVYAYEDIFCSSPERLALTAAATEPPESPTAPTGTETSGSPAAPTGTEATEQPSPSAPSSEPAEPDTPKGPAA